MSDSTSIIRPSVGVSIFIIRGQTVLLGKRKGAHGAGTWGCPGGHLEFGESFEDCAKRETLEETGLVVTNCKQIGVTNDIFVKDNKHYVTVILGCSVVGEPQLLEPDRCEKWEWFDIGHLPTPLFLPMENYIKELYITALKELKDRIQ
jgi:8-oxo-dGTP diphosphatase